MTSVSFYDVCISSSDISYLTNLSIIRRTESHWRGTSDCRKIKDSMEKTAGGPQGKTAAEKKGKAEGKSHCRNSIVLRQRSQKPSR